MNKRPEIIDIIRESYISNSKNVGNRTPSHFVTAPLSKGANVEAASSCPQGKSICDIHRGFPLLPHTGKTESAPYSPE